MIDALIAGERDVEVLSGMALGALAKRADELERALAGSFDVHHARMLTAHLGHHDILTSQIATLDAPIAAFVDQHRAVADRLQTIPGDGRIAAEVIIAEIGVNT